MSCDPVTLEIAHEMFAKYLKAEKAVTTGQSYTIDGRSLTRVNLKEVSNKLQYWRGQVTRLCMTGNAGPSVRRFIPHG